MRVRPLSLVLLPSLSLSLYSCRTSNSGRLAADAFLAPADDATASLDRSESAAAFGLGLNDVSILFPNHQNPDFLAQMPSLADKPNPTLYAAGLDAAAEDNQGFVPDWVGQELANNYNNFPAGSVAKGRVDSSLANFRVAAFRVDPCPNDIQVQGKDAYCVRQLRITWQIQDRRLGPFAMDANVHTAYRLTDPQFKSVMESLRSMHKEASLDTTAMPLGVHPVISKEGPQSPYLKAALGILHRYARASNLMIVAGLRRDDFEGWSMTQYSLNAGKLVQSKLIAVHEAPGDEPARVQRFFANRAATVSLLNTAPLTATAAPLTAPLPNAVTHAEAFENPKLHNALMVDCSSCHQAVHVSRLKTTASQTRDLTKAYTSTTWNITADKGAGGTISSLQMFSFAEGQPKITPRVVNETANVLDYLKTNGL